MEVTKRNDNRQSSKTCSNYRLDWWDLQRDRNGLFLLYCVKRTLLEIGKICKLKKVTIIPPFAVTKGGIMDWTLLLALKTL